jgi:periplasmic divalent cation tolerance protein
MESDYLVVLITAPRENAHHIARHLVENRLAACVNILPEVHSTYHWEGEVHSDTESLLMVKTTTQLFEAVSSTVREIHPYSVPEIIALPITAAYDGYLRWISEQTKPVCKE